ncbi:MAG: hypothetical protein KGH64_00500 [Candidatus Micrarchaeota archaeon]|nr:hypothetical protein [Candidatus Micrarchaeota archaeon]MDE1833796.1 hypothetical protein [Candidatus Micrarchaeota archaeon]MDE1859594.1 hypothetical protein [Candidatus Micrarchaeota archaeon]
MTIKPHFTAASHMNGHFESADAAHAFINAVTPGKIKRGREAQEVGNALMEYGVRAALDRARNTDTRSEEFRSVMVKRVGDLAGRGSVEDVKDAHSMAVALELPMNDVMREMIGKVPELAANHRFKALRVMQDKFGLTVDDLKEGIKLGMGKLIRNGHVLLALRLESEFEIDRNYTKGEVISSIRALNNRGDDDTAGLAVYEFGITRSELAELYLLRDALVVIRRDAMATG